MKEQKYREWFFFQSDFNREKKRTYGFVMLVHCTNKKLFLRPLSCSVHVLSLGTLGAEQLPKQIMAFAAQCCFAIRLFFSLSGLKSQKEGRATQSGLVLKCSLE